MRVNVSQLLQESIGARRSHRFDEPHDERTVWCSADLLRTDAAILVHAECQVPLSTVCGRCLQAFSTQIEVMFDEEFFPSVDISTGARLTPPDEDAFVIDEHHELDLWDAVQQYSILEQPIAFICRDGQCKGLCKQCGNDLNQGACACRAPAKHPAFEQLRREWELHGPATEATASRAEN